MTSVAGLEVRQCSSVGVEQANGSTTTVGLTGANLHHNGYGSYTRGGAVTLDDVTKFMNPPIKITSYRRRDGLKIRRR